MSAFTQQDFIAVVVREARLVDEQRFDEWLDLYADDGHYWMPLASDHTDPRLEPSLMYEDKFLLRVRCERLTGARTFSQKPKSRCHHLLQVPTVEIFAPPDHVVVYTPLHYIETRLDEQTLFGAWTRHHLSVIEDKIKIRLKRVDLVNSDSAFGNIQLFI